MNPRTASNKGLRLPWNGIGERCSSRREEAQICEGFGIDQSLLTSAATILKRALKSKIQNPKSKKNPSAKSQTPREGSGHWRQVIGAGVPPASRASRPRTFPRPVNTE